MANHPIDTFGLDTIKVYAQGTNSGMGTGLAGWNETPEKKCSIQACTRVDYPAGQKARIGLKNPTCSERGPEVLLRLAWIFAARRSDEAAVGTRLEEVPSMTGFPR